MKHAQEAALDKLEPTLRRLRKLRQLRERKRGVFYRGGTAFLHFHEDPKGLFADLRSSSDWRRLPTNSAEELRRLVAAVEEAVAAADRSRTTRSS